MKAHLLRAKRLALLGCLFMAVLVSMPSTASAYSVYVLNDSGAGYADVTLWWSVLLGAKEFGSARIPNGESYTFSTGAKCPGLLSGKIFIPEVGLATIPQMGCAGLIEGDAACGTCCFNIKFKIQKGSDGAYHFKKY